MNIAYMSFTQGLANVPKQLNERLASVNDVHLIVDSETEVNMPCKKFFLSRDCQLGHYPDFDKYDKLPVDEILLVSMSDCESTVLKMMDRYQFSHTLLTYESRINLYHRQLKFWYNYLLEEKIDICVFAVIPHVVYDYIIYRLCKKLGLQTLILYRLPVLPGKNVSIYVLDNIDTHITGVTDAYKKYVQSDSEIVLSDRMHAYLGLKEGNENKTFTGIVKRSKGFRKYFNPKKYISFIKYYSDWLGKWFKLWGKPIDLLYRLVHRLQNIGVKFPPVENAPDLAKKYVLVSLHYQPECTTSPMGGSYVFQDIMVDILMKAMPPDVFLYIKAHPRDGLSKALLKRLKLNDKAILINPEINSFKLIVNSLAVATITGTSGWEAFLNGKPVLMFGNYFYQDAPGVFKIKSFQDAKTAIEAIVNRSETSVISDHMIKAFLKAVEDFAFTGWVDSRYAELSGLSEEENCRNIADAFYLRITTGIKKLN